MGKSRPITAVEQSPELDKLVGEWYEAATVASAAAIAENAARLALVAHFYKEDDPIRSKRGTELFGLPDGWTLDIERRINVRIDRAALDAVIAEIAKLEVDPETGEAPSLDGVISYKPDFSDSGYENLTHTGVKELLDQALTFIPGTPGVKLTQRAPKAQPKATAKASE